MKICIQILLFLASLFLSSEGKGQDFFMSNETEENLNVVPNEKKAIFYNLVGNTSNYNDLSVSYQLPKGWKLITASEVETLRVGQHLQPFFTFQASQNTPAGTSVINITLKNSEEVIATFKIELVVAEIRDIELVVINRPSSISDKEIQEIEYLLINKGNTEEEVTLRSNGDLGKSTTLNLLPGDSHPLTVSHPLPAPSQYLDRVSFVVDAYIEGTTKNYGSAISIPYISSKSKKSDPFHRFPIAVGLAGTYFNDDISSINVMQFDIRGSGFLDQSNRHFLELIASGPNQFDLPRFGNIDQYFLGYKNEKIGELELGDNNYRVSELIEANRFARGIRLGKQLGKWKANLLYAQPRFFDDIRSYFGGGVSYRLNDDVQFKLDLVRKEHTLFDELLETDFLSISAGVNKQKYQLSSEASLSTTNGQTSAAVFNNFILNLDKLKATSNLVYTGKTYNGYYNNSLFVNNSASYPLTPKLRFIAFQNLSQINPSLDSYFLTVAPYSHSNGVELSYKFSRKHQLRANFSNGGREDRMEQKTFHFKEELFRYFYNGIYGNVGVNIDGDFGNVENLLISDGQGSGRQVRQRLNLSYKTNKGISVGGFGEYLNTNKFISTLERNEFLFYGAQANVSIGNKFNMNLFYRNSYAPDELFQTQSFFDFSAAYRHGNHELSFTSSYAYLPAPISEKNFFASLKYTVTINAPLSKKRNLGHVNGRVMGVRNSGVVLDLNGRKIVTDSTGLFSFYDLEPGSYRLHVDKQSLGFGNVVKGKESVSVLINPNSTDSLQLEIVKTGAIGGKVFAFSASDAEPTHIENVLIELKGEGFSKLTTTNSRGGFNFSEIQQGSYTVTLKGKSLKEKYHLSKETFNLYVEEGEVADATFMLEEKQKVIEFQKNTIILSDKNHK